MPHASKNVVAVLTLVLGMGGSVALAGPVSADPSTQLTFAVVPENGTGTPRTATLTCEPVAGTHPDAEFACEDLIKADGHIELIQPVNGMCPHIVQPVTASVTGTWRGSPRSYKKSFTNACHANLLTGGHIFNF
ncbi:SSI family serine proteinase inhibitor [Thermomonospora umbrina]|uniref:Subtilisin inhibitor-like n=1 Tax=Thermomonospora umbrina TaxID=111806 RepID=A0A3D9SHL9_9ACTN|nr:SSI family serine proteinase inhibitor [Thermomonospora umbrina]REE95382.1 subtilisin inhibitor-like [Thermomonospora umbrina]